MGLALEALRATGAKLRKNFQYVFIEIMFLYVSVRKINFTQMGKYGKHCEQTYRNNFTKQVDWLAYNTFLTGKVFDKPGDLIAIAVDQSHITKYGKCTWGMGKFWSGCDKKFRPETVRAAAGDYKRQLEDKTTAAFLADLRKEPLLKGILAGHLHISVQDRFSPTAIEYVVGPNFLFHGQEVIFT